MQYDQKKKTKRGREIKTEEERSPHDSIHENLRELVIKINAKIKNNSVSEVRGYKTSIQKSSLYSQTRLEGENRRPYSQ